MDSEKVIRKLQKRIGKEQALKNVHQRRLTEAQLYIRQLESNQEKLLQEKNKQEEQLLRLDAYYQQQLLVNQVETIWQEFQRKLTIELLLADQSQELASAVLETEVSKLKEQIYQWIKLTLPLN